MKALQSQELVRRFQELEPWFDIICPLPQEVGTVKIGHMSRQNYYQLHTQKTENSTWKSTGWRSLQAKRGMNTHVTIIASTSRQTYPWRQFVSKTYPRSAIRPLHPLLISSPFNVAWYLTLPIPLSLHSIKNSVQSAPVPRTSWGKTWA